MLLRLARFFSSMLSQFLKKLVALHYGQGVEKPVFALRNYCLVSKATQTHRQMGKQQEHIKLFGRFADAVGFQLAEAYQSLGCPSTVDPVSYTYLDVYKRQAETSRRTSSLL